MNETPVRNPLLEGGELLRVYKDHYLGDPNSQNLSVLLMALHDSWVFTPEAATARAFHRDGGAYYPVYSSPDQLPEGKGGNVVLREAPFVECARAAESMDDVEGLVLDPYTQYLILPQSFLSAAVDIDTKNAPYQP